MKENLFTILEVLGLALIATGIVIPLVTLDIYSDTYKYIFSAGALLVLISRLFSPYKGTNLRLKRLHHIEVWGSLFFCAAAFFMFYNNPPSMRDPIVMVLAGGLIHIYTSIMIPRVAKKDRN